MKRYNTSTKCLLALFVLSTLGSATIHAGDQKKNSNKGKQSNNKSVLNATDSQSTQNLTYTDSIIQELLEQDIQIIDWEAVNALTELNSELNFNAKAKFIAILLKIHEKGSALSIETIQKTAKLTINSNTNTTNSIASDITETHQLENTKSVWQEYVIPTVKYTAVAVIAGITGYMYAKKKMTESEKD